MTPDRTMDDSLDSWMRAALHMRLILMDPETPFEIVLLMAGAMDRLGFYWSLRPDTLIHSRRWLQAA